MVAGHPQHQGGNNGRPAGHYQWVGLSGAVLPAAYTVDEGGRVVLARPAGPCPELLTKEEAIWYLRLDTIEGTKNPAGTLERYRSNGKLKGTQVGKKIFYRRVELERFLERQTDENPR